MNPLYRTNARETPLQVFSCAALLPSSRQNASQSSLDDSYDPPEPAALPGPLLEPSVTELLKGELQEESDPRDAGLHPPKCYRGMTKRE